MIAANPTAFFPSGETNVLTVFIAWLNLDLGIETCFFDGMDMYSKTWLQFVSSPLHLAAGWNDCPRKQVFTNVCQDCGQHQSCCSAGNFFLLSYTKLLRTIIAALSLTTLEYPDKTVSVWAYDGNIRYLDKNDGRHIALFLASLLIFLFLFVPYTLILLLGSASRLDQT